jgi:ariadne-1
LTAYGMEDTWFGYIDFFFPEQQSRQSLERYLFYFNRYANHNNSLKLEANLFEKVKKMMNEMQV